MTSVLALCAVTVGINLTDSDAELRLCLPLQAPESLTATGSDTNR
jgi:hypothetical protein